MYCFARFYLTHICAKNFVSLHSWPKPLRLGSSSFHASTAASCRYFFADQMKLVAVLARILHDFLRVSFSRLEGY